MAGAVSVLAALPAWQGCSADTEAVEVEAPPVHEATSETTPAAYVQGEIVDRSVVQQLLPDWPGVDVGLEWPAGFYVGPMAHPGQVPDGTRPLSEVLRELKQLAGPLALTTVWEDHMFLIDLQPSKELEEMMEAALDRELDRVIAEEGLATDSADDPSAQSAADGVGVAAQALWIGGTDGRKPLHLPNNAPSGQASYAKEHVIGAIGLLKGTSATVPICTGTLVGPKTAPMVGFFARLVLTAAHCLLKDDGSGGVQQETYRFFPRADSASGGTPEYPWGTWNGQTQILLPADFTMLNCQRDAVYAINDECRTHDWALVRFIRPAAAVSQKAFFRVRTFPNDQWSGARNRGYPSCVEANHPVPCVPETLYGDTGFCISSTLKDSGTPECDPANPGTKCFRPRADHECDTSGGHSGGPIYRYIEQRPTIGGIAVAENPTTGKNHMRRVTVPMVSQILNAVANPSNN